MHTIQKHKKYVYLSLISIALAFTGMTVLMSCSQKSSAGPAKPNFITKDAPRAGVVAKIGGQEITEEDLIGDEKLNFFELDKRAYELKMSRLNKLLVDKLIGAEAKSANMSTEDYIQKNLLKGDIKISDADYNKFVKDKKIPESQINPGLKERILSFMKENKKEDVIQAHVAKLTKNNPVEVYFKKPKLMMNVEVGKAPYFGGENAKVTIVEFSDFQCPFCSRGAETVNELKKKYGNKIKLAFRHFPLPMHPDAKPAAMASMCMNEQGKFWKYHDILFKNQDKLSADELAKYAKEVGADEKKFKECVESKRHEAVVAEDLAYGEKIGVKSTPTFFINGQLVSGAVPIENFSEIIDDELAAK